jgi:hypothetical protein
MEIQVKIRIGNDLAGSKDVVERLVWENLNKKLDQYLNKFTKDDSEGIIELSAEKNKKNLFNAKINANLDWKVYIFEREDYKNLDDLINHLFDHFKVALSDEK